MRRIAKALLAGLTLLAGFGFGLPQASAERGAPGKFDYYALVLSWSPTHCAESRDRRDDMQCARRDGRRYGFIMHGLWPQYAQGYPESCALRGRDFVPRPVIDDMLDIMPAPGLIIHEYKKHGTCSGMNAKEYFAFARKLFASIKTPPELVNPFEAQTLGVREIEKAFLAANPELKPDMISIACGGGKLARLKEIRICFSKEGKPVGCGSNEEQGKVCRSDKLFVPPVRSTKR